LQIIGKCLSTKTLIVCKSIDENLKYATRNVPNLFVVSPESLDPLVLTKSKKILISTEAIPKLESMFL